MSKIKLDGIFVPHITPFARNGAVDRESLRVCVRFWIKSGISGLVPCGSNGEAPYLSRSERREIVKIVMDEVNGEVPVIVGTGSPSTWETIAFTKDAKDLGADAVLVVTPYYFKLTRREMQSHYESILNAVDIPIILYNVPKFTGYSLEPILTSELASHHEGVIGIKDGSGSMGLISETITLIGDRISVLAGTADVVLPTLILGGRGAIIAVANVFPEICIELYKAYEQRDYQRAQTLQLQIAHINEILMKRYNQLSAIKEGLRLRGISAGCPRRPSLVLNNEEKEVISKELRDSNADLEISQ